MKIGSAVVGLHIAVLCAFALTQGCVTTESSGSGRGAGAKHKGPWKHEHKGKAAETSSAVVDPYYTDDTMQDDSMYTGDAIIMDSPSTVEPLPPSSYQGTTEVYIVQKGDILSQLAVDFDTTTATLVEMNGLSNPDVLYVGQELRVPAGRTASKTTTKSTGSIKKGGTYTIQKGDTLSEIASAADVSIADLRQLNGIQGDTIMAGDTLDIPSYGTVPPSSRSSSTPKAESRPTPVEPAPAEPMVAPPAIADPATTPDDPASSQEMSFTAIDEKIVYPGETLDDISRQYGVSKAEILRLNNLTDESQVTEGQRLRIPSAE